MEYVEHWEPTVAAEYNKEKPPARLHLWERALPAIDPSAKLSRGQARSHSPLIQQHRIPIAEEPIALRHRLPIRRQNMLAPGKGAHQHHQRRL